MTKRVCSVPGCPALTDGGRCATHRTQADQARGTAAQRGYTSRGHTKRFRPAVLAKHPICVLCQTARATVADHYPLSRRELVDQGMDPDNPDYGRGLCAPCHGRHTSQAQPGGWHADRTQ